jgi:hypothetical protein
MVISASHRAVRAWRLVRLLVLLPISVLIGHDAIFALQYGLGDNLRQAMSLGGHDGYWMALSVVIVGLALAVLAREGQRWLRLWLRTRTIRTRATERGRPTWLPEVRRIWPALLALTSIAFAIQENIEHVAIGEPAPGLGVLVGAEHPAAIPILAAITLLVAAVGSLVRWRVAILEYRVATAAHRPRERGLHPQRPGLAWPALAALCSHRWLLVRLDVGRAPPQLVG